MSKLGYPEEFKIQAVNQVTERKLFVADVADRLGVSPHSSMPGQSAKANLEISGSSTMISTLNRGVCELNSTGYGRTRHLKKGRRILC